MSNEQNNIEPLGTVAFQYIILLILIGVLLHLLSADIGAGLTATQQTIESFIIASKSYAFIVYVLFVILMAISPMPSSTLGVLGGYLFGTYWAILLTLIGEMLGAFANYYIGTVFGTVLMDEKRFPRIAEFLNKYTNKLTPATVFLLGIIPVGTTNVTGYAAALSKMKLKTFVFAWTLGAGIMVVSTTLLGHSAKVQMPFFSAIVIVSAIILFYGIKIILKKTGNEIRI